LLNLFDDVKEKKVDVQTAKTLVGTSNAVLKSVQLELEQNKFVGNKKKIAFLG
jgi:hypothetical protein